MNITRKDSTVTIQLTDNESAQLAQCEEAFGELVLTELVTNWLASHARTFREEALKEVMVHEDLQTELAAVLDKARARKQQNLDGDQKPQ